LHPMLRLTCCLRCFAWEKLWLHHLGAAFVLSLEIFPTKFGVGDNLLFGGTTNLVYDRAFPTTHHLSWEMSRKQTSHEVMHYTNIHLQSLWNTCFACVGHSPGYDVADASNILAAVILLHDVQKNTRSIFSCVVPRADFT
jgi:hypothetical protein